MTQITGGRVTYGRTVQPAQYESKKMEAELTFAISEGDGFEETFAHAAFLAIDKVHEVLGLARPKAPEKPTTAKQSVEEIKAALKTEAIAQLHNGQEVKTATVTTKADLEAAAKKKANGPKKPPAVDPAAIDVVTEQGQLEPAKVPTKDADPAAMDDVLTGEAAPITDVDLTGAITRKNAVLKNPVAIRQLIGKYVAPPKQAREIAPEHRTKFLEELAAL